MSAYIVSPRTIDYLVSWANRHRGESLRTQSIRGSMLDLPDELAVAATNTGAGFTLDLAQISETDLGALLLRENVRSVRYRYPEDSADELAGPVDQARVWRYEYRPVDASLLRAGWVVKSCDCLEYQSCETPDWESTVAYAVVEAIRDSAVRVLCEDAPWGVDDHDLEELRGLPAGIR